ncbi:sigma 54-interacting transcriptional regulator [Desulfococcaceae bacterium HSG7]|nr:sigma 54-interacting transcriptional regulator [Desulfococcaceae bacterium HSG7]
MNYGSSRSYTRLSERIEIIRSSLRWTQRLDRTGIDKILHQVNHLRDDVRLFAGPVLYKKSVAAKKIKKPTSAALRRQALLDRSFQFKGIFGENPKLLETLETVEKAAHTDLPILIEGESGTGKELLAEVVQANSERSEQPFISVNCGAITPTLLEAELFGHVKGAFTGANRNRHGKFEAAANGTIFLDEIGELSQENQVKLLRVLQNGEIQRVGSDQVITVDTRVVAATNRNLYQMIQDGCFREDLYYRLSVISVTLPPLRERSDEIPLLIDFISKNAAKKMNRQQVKLTPRLRRFLLNYSYRGNVRELQNIIDRLSCLADAMADIEHLPEQIRPIKKIKTASATDQKAGPLTLNDIKKAAGEAAEKEFLEEQLIITKGNVTELAKRLGKNRSYLQTLLKKRGIRAKGFKAKAVKRTETRNNDVNKK